MQYKAVQSAQYSAVKCTTVQCSTIVGDSVQSHDTAKGSLRVPGQYIKAAAPEALGRWHLTH
jgi:hypothetical protein